MKNARQLKILEIIGNTAIETQEELMAALRAEGFVATQATMSRDIKELHLNKVPLQNGRYKYAISQSQIESGEEKIKYRNVLEQVLISAVAAENIGVIKTLTGTANAAAAALEYMGYTEIIGTIAGDDTLLCIFANDRSAFDFCSKLNSMFIKN